jgi:hypothetical protein
MAEENPQVAAPSAEITPEKKPRSFKSLKVILLLAVLVIIIIAVFVTVMLSQSGVRIDEEDNIIQLGDCESSADCPPTHFCKNGECFKKPVNCPADVDEVCGTNNQTYTNDCIRNLAGADKAYDGPCVSESGSSGSE